MGVRGSYRLLGSSVSNNTKDRGEDIGDNNKKERSNGLTQQTLNLISQILKQTVGLQHICRGRFYP